jgi:hypothetical protein
MYPSSATELTALIAVLVPLVVATFSGLRGVGIKSLENDLVRWRRLNELAKALYNKDHEYGQWAQIAAVYELASYSAPHKDAANAILADAKRHFGQNEKLSQAIMNAQAGSSLYRLARFGGRLKALVGAQRD